MSIFQDKTDQVNGQKGTFAMSHDELGGSRPVLGGVDSEISSVYSTRKIRYYGCGAVIRPNSREFHFL